MNVEDLPQSGGNESASPFPKVQKYVIMSAAGSYTDFHIDFGGSSVWYHVVKGAKWFYLIAPTPEHLEAYSAWIHSKRQLQVRRMPP